MSYNGSGTFQINSTGQPVVGGTIISSATFNALTADLATGLTTAITKDGQTTATARIPFAQGITSTLVTDASSTATGSIITAGGVGIAKKLYVGTDLNVGAGVLIIGLTASSAVATDASKNLISVTNTGTGSNVLGTSPTITTATLASANLTTALTLAGAAGTNGQVLTSAGSGLPSWTTPGSGGFSTMSVSTSSNTFTIPSGITTIKITVVGGGGGGGNANGSTDGATGGTSSVASGTQTITTISATGGGGTASSGTQPTDGGVGSGGQLNITGSSGQFNTSNKGGVGGGSIFGGSGKYCLAGDPANNGNLYGGGGGGSVASGSIGNGGSGGGASIKYFTGLTPGNTLTVTVGTGGAGGTGTYPGGAGAAGVVIFEY